MPGNCETCGGVGKTELASENQTAYWILRKASASWGWGFSLQGAFDAAALLGVEATREELNRVHLAWAKMQSMRNKHDTRN